MTAYPSCRPTSALLLGLVLAVLSTATACNSSELLADQPQRVCGRMLYLRHCMSCHGATGLGDGPGAEMLEPRPRDFSQATFRLVSTDNGVPTDDDLYAVITRGIVGSAMPPHEHLSEAQRWALVRFVRGLTRSRRADVLQAQAEADGAPLTRKQALAAATDEPGTTVQLPELEPPIPELLAEGRELYVTSCAPCHGDDGTGGRRDDMLDNQGQPVAPRDFTAGVMKGGSDLANIHRRIRCGMPGSPMPALALPPRQALALTHYVASLLHPEAQDRLSQVHTTFSPQLVDALPNANPQAPVWDAVAPHWVALAPLQWSDHRVPGVLLQIARDERSLAMRLVWEDSTPADGGGNVSPDTAAIRFSPVKTPQFFCPGRTDETGEEWNWEAEAGDTDSAAPLVTIRSRHRQGFYELVFMRDLSERTEHVGMSPAGVSIAFEIRNGAAGSPNRSQNITVWHRLER